MPRVGLQASRAMIGAPLQAAAGRATAVELQTTKSTNFLGYLFSHIDRVHKSVTYEPYPEGHWRFSPASRLWISDIGAVGRFA
jgi:hypothetical protein